MAHRMLRDAEADGWERSDFPIICESCLGDNPYVRMTKANFDKECKICTRPFTVFRWRPGREARYKKTEVCQTCSKLKNVCQVCLLDLEYGLPVQVRDTALGLENDVIPKSDVNREFFAEEADRKAKSGQDFDASHGRAKPNDLILKLQRTTPYYKRNRAHICSFFVRGECTRGAECPYRHEMPVEGPLAHQNLKDRFYGVNDPVAAKLLQKAGEMPSLAPPEDQAIMTLYVGGLDTRVTETDLRDQFYGWGEIAGIKLVPTKQCAFVTYTSREGAEKAAENLANKLVIKGLRLRLMWGKPHMQKGEEGGAGGPSRAPPTSVIRAGLLPRAVLPTQQMAQQQQQQVGVGSQVHPAEPPPPASAPVNYFNMPPPPPAAIAAATAGNEQAYYPSMDPEQMGAARPKAGDDNATRPGGSSSLSGPGAPQRPVPPPRPFLPPSYGPGPPPPYPNSQANQQQLAPPGVAPSHYGYGQNESTEQQQQYFQPPPQQELPPGYSQPTGMQPGGAMQPPPMAPMVPPPPPPPGMMPRGYHQQYMSRPQYYSRGNY